MHIKLKGQDSKGNLVSAFSIRILVLRFPQFSFLFPLNAIVTKNDTYFALNKAMLT